jgi:hypothetical protein
MPTPEELEEPLKAFRETVVKEFANLRMEIEALQSAVQEAPVSSARLEELRGIAAKSLHNIRGEYVEAIKSWREPQ